MTSNTITYYSTICTDVFGLNQSRPGYLYNAAIPGYKGNQPGDPFSYLPRSQTNHQKKSANRNYIGQDPTNRNYT